jgi:hypothetical protein
MGDAVWRACRRVLVGSRRAVVLVLGGREVHHRREGGRAVALGQGPAWRSRAEMAVAERSMPGQAGCMYMGGCGWMRQRRRRGSAKQRRGCGRVWEGVRCVSCASCVQRMREMHPGEPTADVSRFAVWRLPDWTGTGRRPGLGQPISQGTAVEPSVRRWTCLAALVVRDCWSLAAAAGDRLRARAASLEATTRCASRIAARRVVGT